VIYMISKSRSIYDNGLAFKVIVDPVWPQMGDEVRYAHSGMSITLQRMQLSLYSLQKPIPIEISHLKVFNSDLGKGIDTVNFGNLIKRAPRFGARWGGEMFAAANLAQIFWKFRLL
jgi:hypothetical protein